MKKCYPSSGRGVLPEPGSNRGAADLGRLWTER
jgi:hypothetical protein